MECFWKSAVTADFRLAHVHAEKNHSLRMISQTPQSRPRARGEEENSVRVTNAVYVSPTCTRRRIAIRFYRTNPLKQPLTRLWTRCNKIVRSKNGTAQPRLAPRGQGWNGEDSSPFLGRPVSPTGAGMVRRNSSFQDGSQFGSEPLTRPVRSKPPFFVASGKVPLARRLFLAPPVRETKRTARGWSRAVRPLLPRTK